MLLTEKVRLSVFSRRQTG